LNPIRHSVARELFDRFKALHSESKRYHGLVPGSLTFTAI
jgi:hypothetical protein